MNVEKLRYFAAVCHMKIYLLFFFLCKRKHKVTDCSLFYDQIVCVGAGYWRGFIQAELVNVKVVGANQCHHTASHMLLCVCAV